MINQRKKRFSLGDFFNFFSIRSKLQAILLLTSLISILATGTISYFSARQALNKSIYNGLTALRVRQAGEVEQFFERMGDEVLSLSESPTIVEAFKDFQSAYKKLDTVTLPPAQAGRLTSFYQQEVIPRLSSVSQGAPDVNSYLPQDNASRYVQSYYIASNPYPFGQKSQLNRASDDSDYTKAHAYWHPRFKRIADLFSYYDIMMTDGESGRVIYNISKELDFGTNLKEGIFSSTNVADAFRRVLRSQDPNFVTLTDFELYRPSFDNPSAFIATTIHDGGKFIGSLVFQLPSNKLQDVMTVNQKWREVGLGETGESILVGPDFKVRSEPRLFIENRDQFFAELRKKGVSDQDIDKMWKLNTAILQHERKNPAIEAALNGETGTKKVPDYRGVDTLISYETLNLGKNVDKPLKWALLTKMTEAEAFKPIRDLTKLLLGASAILLPLVALFSNWIANLFTRPINRLVEGTKRMSAGETDIHVKVTSKDEFGELAQSFNEMSHSLHEKEMAIQEHLAENERLLLNVLPPSAVKRVREGDRDFADTYTNISLLYAEIEGFSDLVQTVDPSDSVLLLNELIGAFDECAETFGVEKLKTVGTSYLAVCGLSVPRIDHAKRIVDFAVEMIGKIQRLNQAHDSHITLDIGIHSGSVVGGIVGKSKFIYEIWGDSLKIAYGIHSSPEDNVIQVTQPIHDALEKLYTFKEIGVKAIKGMEDIPIWQVDYDKSRIAINGNGR